MEDLSTTFDGYGTGDPEKKLQPGGEVRCEGVEKGRGKIIGAEDPAQQWEERHSTSAGGADATKIRKAASPPAGGPYGGGPAASTKKPEPESPGDAILPRYICLNTQVNKKTIAITTANEIANSTTVR